MREYENGLCRVGHSTKTHLINPIPMRDGTVVPFCKPNSTTAAVHETDTECPDVTCKRCITKRDGVRA